MDSESLSSWTNTPPHPPASTFLAQHSCRLGREVCWFLRWPPYSCSPLFKVVHEYLYAQTVWKMKINLQLNGRWLDYLFPLGGERYYSCSKWECLVLFIFFFPHIPECPYIKLGMFFLIREFFLTLLWSLSTHSRTKQFRNISFMTFEIILQSQLFVYTCRGNCSPWKPHDKSK